MALALLEVNELHFRYPGQEGAALNGVSLSVRPGEFIVLCGPSGSGKTTLLRHLKPELRPAGETSGSVDFAGMPLEEHAAQRLAGDIAFVQQDPENQIVTDRVDSELYFALENVGLEPDAMRRRVAEMAHMFGLEPWLDGPTFELSGGQKQLLNLASALVLHPRLLLLDEPTAQLDPIAAKDFVHLLRRLNEEFGLTIVMTEHRLEELFPLADRVIVMEDGRIVCDGQPREAIDAMLGRDAERYEPYIPALAQLFKRLNGAANRPMPLTIKEGRDWLRSVHGLAGIEGDATASYGEGELAASATHAASAPQAASAGQTAPAATTASAATAAPAATAAATAPQAALAATAAVSAPQAASASQAASAPQAASAATAASAPQAASAATVATAAASARQAASEAGETVLACRDVFFQYDRKAPLVLKGLTLDVREGDFLAVLGGNGAGKSTLLQLTAGLLKPQRGTVRYRGSKVTGIPETERYRQIGYLAQNPMLYFVHDTVEQELCHAAERAGRREPGAAIAETAALLGLTALLGRHPYDLSGGEKQKAALATVLLSKPQLLVIDEPTKGLDPHAKRALGALLGELHAGGLPIVMVTHDIEFAARFANRCALLFDGVIASDGAPGAFFGENYFYTTAVNRLLRDRCPQALVWEDGLACFERRG